MKQLPRFQKKLIDMLNYEAGANKEVRRTQREKIVKLLKTMNFVPTSILHQFAPQYNARLYELRRGLHDNKMYVIEATTEYYHGTNVHGFVLRGTR